MGVRKKFRATRRFIFKLFLSSLVQFRLLLCDLSELLRGKRRRIIRLLLYDVAPRHKSRRILLLDVKTGRNKLLTLKLAEFHCRRSFTAINLVRSFCDVINKEAIGFFESLSLSQKVALLSRLSLLFCSMPPGAILIRPLNLRCVRCITRRLPSGKLKGCV